MRNFLFGSTIVSLFVVGCANESTPGGPGAKSPTTSPTERSYRDASADETFTLKVPSGTTNIDPGERKEVTISIDRGDNFKQTVALKFKAPAGVKVEPTDVQLKSDQEEAKVTLVVGADAPMGEWNIDVTATPETGKATSMSMRVKVEEKETK
jgi:uncharacterized membrane protein